MPPNLYPSIPSHQVCLCPYCTSTPMYAPYVVTHYIHIPSLCYLHTSSSKLPSSVFTPHPTQKYEWIQKEEDKYKINKAKNKQRPSISRTHGENHDLVSVYIDGSHEDQGNNKAIRFLLPQKNPTIYLIATANSDHNSVHNDDDEEDDLPT